MPGESPYTALNALNPAPGNVNGQVYESMTLTIALDLVGSLNRNNGICSTSGTPSIATARLGACH